MMYVVTKILGVDAIKTAIYDNREKAQMNIEKWVRMLAPEENNYSIIEKGNGEVHYLINESKDPTEYILFILKPCEIIK